MSTKIYYSALGGPLVARDLFVHTILSLNGMLTFEECIHIGENKRYFLGLSEVVFGRLVRLNTMVALVCLKTPLFVYSFLLVRRLIKFSLFRITAPIHLFKPSPTTHYYRRAISLGNLWQRLLPPPPRQPRVLLPQTSYLVCNNLSVSEGYCPTQQQSDIVYFLF